jgi:hypothetical protein
MSNYLKYDPFFIVGCPRSGTTLLQLLVASHPHIAIPPESHIFVRFSKIFENYGDLEKDSNLKLLVKDLLEDYHIRDWKLGITVEEFCSQLEEKTLRDIISLLMSIYAQKEGKVRWGDKTPQHALFVNEIKSVFPEAKYIHLIRDGRDVAVSSCRIFVGPPSIYGIAHEWSKYIHLLNQFKKLVDSRNYLEIQYEKLVRDTQAEVGRIFNFLGEQPIPIGSEIPTSSAKKYYVQADLHMHSLKKPISDKKIGLFRKTFNKRQIAIFETIAKDALKLHDYHMLTTGFTKVGGLEKIKFFLIDKFYRYYRKYFRPSELGRVWFLFRREWQAHVRTFIRSLRTKELHKP